MTVTQTYALPALQYELDALQPVISPRIMELHHGTHHRAYVNAANELLDKLGGLSGEADPSTLTRALAFNVSGHTLHSLFWTCMSPNGGGQPPPGLALAISTSFGSVDAMVARLTAAVERLSGSGWGALVWEPTAERLLVTQIHDHHNDQIAGSIPILVIDGWEHAYYLQYEAGRAKWAAAFWDLVDWKRVASRLEDARTGTEAGTRIRGH